MKRSENTSIVLDFFLKLCYNIIYVFCYALPKLLCAFYDLISNMANQIIDAERLC